jgi:hypothetical protein
MKILIIDNKLHRHSFHYDVLSSEFSDIEIVEKIDSIKLKNSQYDIIIVHRNNDELDIIEKNKDIGKLRIIFSGNLQHYQKNDVGHYIPISQYEERVKSIIIDFQQSLEKI